MEWTQSLQIIKDLRDCRVCEALGRHVPCKGCKLHHTYPEVIEALQQARFALEELIKSEEEEAEK